MKKAIGYIRISDKDQSSFSIPGQKETLQTHCSKNDIELLTIFTDDGESAKNFDRTDWKNLYSFIKQYHNSIDYLIVAKFDRFSRNTAEALQMIDKLEKQFNIRVISVMEPIQLHPDSPYFHHFRSQILQNAELELRIIRDRTKFGMQQAAKSGRYVSTAPFGYINTRDETNKPILVIHEEKATIVREIYNRFFSGELIASIRKAVRSFTVRGNSAVQSLLQNPVYMGYVRKPAYYDEPETLVKGIHEAIVTEETWYKVQAIFNSKKPLQRSALNESVPLKGVLKCYCGRCLTAGNSRGRSNYYWYYKCNSHPQHNLAAGKLHSQFDEILKVLSFPKFHLDYLQSQVMIVISQRLKERSKELSAKESELCTIQTKIDNLEEKYISNDIDPATYKKWKGRYLLNKSTLQSQLTDLRQPIEAIWNKHRANMDKLADLHYLYQCGTLEKKQAFIRQVFNNELYYQEGSYRTAFLLSPFLPKAMELKEKRLLIYQQPFEESQQNERSAPRRSIIEPLERLLFWAETA